MLKVLQISRKVWNMRFRLPASAFVSAAGVTVTPLYKSARVSAFTGRSY